MQEKYTKIILIKLPQNWPKEKNLKTEGEEDNIYTKSQ